MVDTSKILTVSYGTFSCTLEGFDEPFSTMKAIAEYFRDLAAEDRYFGAEPPTPDAETLHRIAEKAISNRVDARVGDNSVTLRAYNNAEGTADIAADDDDAGIDVDALLGSGAGEPEITAAQALAQERPAESVLAYEEEETGPQSSVIPISSGLESVAAKLARIRAAVAQDNAATGPASDDLTDAAAHSGADNAVSFFAKPGTTGADTVSADQAHDAAAEAARAQAEAEAARAAMAAEAEARAAEDAEEARRAQEEEAAQIEAGQKAEAKRAAAEEAERQAAQEAETARLAAEAEAERQAAVEAQQEADRLAAEAAEAARRAEEDAATEQAAAEAASAADTDAATEAEAEAEAEKPAAAPFLLQGASTPDAAPQDDVAFEAELAAALAEAPEDLRPADQTTSSEMAQAGARRQVRVLKVKRAQSNEAQDGDKLVADVKRGQPIEPEAPAAANPAAAATQEQPEGRAENHPGREALESVHSDDDAAVARIMAATDDRLQGEDTRRRIDSISHLKAAVAATRAERSEARPDADKDAAQPYREDLADVVGTTPVPDMRSKRPAPLVLVSEQRIDQPSDHARELLQRRRITTAGRDTASDQQHSDALSNAKSFEEYADEVGASDLPDLLEAAAAYVSFVEGSPHFSRPQIMGHVQQARGEAEYSREDGLRTFGTLLRNGTIRKLKRGRFAISEDSRFIPDDERAAG